MSTYRNIFVNEAWEDLEAGTQVQGMDGKVRVFGESAFASLDEAVESGVTNAVAVVKVASGKYEYYTADAAGNFSVAGQVMYVDFNGGKFSYDNGEYSRPVEMAAADYSSGQQEEIIAALNDKNAASGIVFTANPQVSGEYSTIHVGSTPDLGGYRGLAETIDKGNAIKTDEAFVDTGKTASIEDVINVIDHEAGHLVGEEHAETTGTLDDFADPVYVAQIGDTKYTSLADAFSYACEQYTAKTITLINNATIDSTITLSNHKAVTLDMAGYDITVNASGYAFSTAEGRGGDFTLTSSSEGSEIISATPSTVTGFLSVDAADAAKGIAVEKISFHGASGADAAYSTSVTSSMFYDNNTTKPTNTDSVNEIALTSVNIVTDGDIVKGAGNDGKAYVKVYVKYGEYSANHGFSYDAYSYTSSFYATTITTNGYAVKTDSSTNISYPTASEPGTTITVNGSDAAVIVSRSNYQYAAGDYNDGILIKSSTITANGTGAAVQVIDGGKVTLQSSTVISTNSAGHVLEIGVSGGTIGFGGYSGRVTLDGSKADVTIVDKASSGNGKIVMKYVDAKAGTNGLVNLTEMGDNAQVELYYGSSTYQGKINVFENGNQYVRLTSAITLVNGGQVVYSSDSLFNYGGSIKVNTAGLAAGTYKVIDYTGAAGGAATYTGKVSIVSGCPGELSYGTEAGGDYGDVYVTIEALERFQISDGTTTTKYATLSEAVAAVQNGQTIELLKDVNELENITVDSGKSFTINLAGFSYFNTQTLTNNGTVTLTGAVSDKTFDFKTVTNNASGIINVGSTGSLTTKSLNDGGAVNVADGGVLDFDYSSSSLSVKADTADTAVLNISGGAVVKNSKSNWIGYDTQYGKLSVTGTGTSFTSTAQLNVDTKGTLDVLNRATVTVSGYYNDGAVNMDITGAQIVVTGDSMGGSGTLTVDLNNVASGTYKLVDYQGTWNLTKSHYGTLKCVNGIGSFSIGTGDDKGDLFVTVVNPVCQIGEVKYGSLNEAFGAVQNGETITLIDNAVLDSATTIDKSITLDMAGYDITVNASGSAFNVKMKEAGKSFVITDSTATATVRNSEIINGGSGTNLIWLEAGLTGSPTATVDISNVSVHGASGATAAYSSSHAIYDDSLNVDTIKLTNVSIYTNNDVITGAGMTGTDGSAFAWSNLNISGSTLKSYNGRGVRFGGDNIVVSSIDKTSITSANGIAVYAFSKATLSDSTIDMTAPGKYDAVASSGAVYGANAVLTITGTTDVKAHNASSAVAVESGGLVVIENGTFKNDNTNEKVVKANTSGGNIKIKGGVVDGSVARYALYSNTAYNSYPDPEAAVTVTEGSTAVIIGGAEVSSDNAHVRLAGGIYQRTVNVREYEEIGGQYVRITGNVTLDVAAGGQFSYGGSAGGNTSDTVLVSSYTDKIITADVTGATAGMYKVIDYLGNNAKTMDDYYMVKLGGEGASDYTLMVYDKDLYVVKQGFTVDDDWKDLDDGTVVDDGIIGLNAFGTIQKAVDAANVSEGAVTINVKAGTYNEEINLNKSNLAFTEDETTWYGRLNIVGAEGAKITGAGFTFGNGPSINIADLAISGFTFEGYVNSIYIDNNGNNGKNIAITNNTFNFAGAGIYVMSADMDGVTISGNKFNSAAGNNAIIGGNNSLINNIEISGNTFGNFFGLYGSVGEDNATISGNTFTGGNTGYGIWINNTKAANTGKIILADNDFATGKAISYPVGFDTTYAKKADIVLSSADNTYAGTTITGWAEVANDKFLVSSKAGAGCGQYYDTKLYLGDETSFTSAKTAYNTATDAGTLVMMNNTTPVEVAKADISMTTLQVDDDWSAKAQGAQVTVGTNNYYYGLNAYGNLTDAVAMAKDAATTEIAVAAGTYADSDVDIRKSVKLKIADGGVVVDIANPETSGFTFYTNSADATYEINGGKLTLASIWNGAQTGYTETLNINNEIAFGAATETAANREIWNRNGIINFNKDANVYGLDQIANRGTINIAKGAAVTAYSYEGSGSFELAGLSDMSGVMTIEGVLKEQDGGVWGDNKTATVANDGQTGTLNVQNGGQLNFARQTLSVGANGTVNVLTGGSITVKGLTNAGAITMGNTSSFTYSGDWSNTGTFTVDVTNAAPFFTVVDYTGSDEKTLASYGNITLTGTDAGTFEVKVLNNDLVVQKKGTTVTEAEVTTVGDDVVVTPPTGGGKSGEIAVATNVTAPAGSVAVTNPGDGAVVVNNVTANKDVLVTNGVTVSEVPTSGDGTVAVNTIKAENGTVTLKTYDTETTAGGIAVNTIVAENVDIIHEGSNSLNVLESVTATGENKETTIGTHVVNAAAIIDNITKDADLEIKANVYVKGGTLEIRNETQQKLDASGKLEVKDIRIFNNDWTKDTKLGNIDITNQIEAAGNIEITNSSEITDKGTGTAKKGIVNLGEATHTAGGDLIINNTKDNTINGSGTAATETAAKFVVAGKVDITNAGHVNANVVAQGGITIYNDSANTLIGDYTGSTVDVTNTAEGAAYNVTFTATEGDIDLVNNGTMDTVTFNAQNNLSAVRISYEGDAAPAAITNATVNTNDLYLGGESLELVDGTVAVIHLSDNGDTVNGGTFTLTDGTVGTINGAYDGSAITSGQKRGEVVLNKDADQLSAVTIDNVDKVTIAKGEQSFATSLTHSYYMDEVAIAEGATLNWAYTDGNVKTYNIGTTPSVDDGLVKMTGAGTIAFKQAGEYSLGDMNVSEFTGKETVDSSSTLNLKEATDYSASGSEIENAGTVNFEGSSATAKMKVTNTGTVNVKDETNFTAKVTNSGTVNVDAASTFANAANTGTVNVNADTDFTDLDNDATVNVNTENVTGTIDNDGIINVAEAATLAGSIANDGTINANKATTISATLTGAGAANVNENTALTGNVSGYSGTYTAASGKTGTFEDSATLATSFNLNGEGTFTFEDQAKSFDVISDTNATILNVGNNNATLTQGTYGDVTGTAAVNTKTNAITAEDITAGSVQADSALTAASITAATGDITANAAVTATGNIKATAGNITANAAVSGADIEATAGAIDVAAAGTLTATGNISAASIDANAAVTATAGSITATGTIDADAAVTAGTTISAATLNANKAVTAGTTITATTLNANATVKATAGSITADNTNISIKDGGTVAAGALSSFGTISVTSDTANFTTPYTLINSVDAQTYAATLNFTVGTQSSDLTINGKAVKFGNYFVKAYTETGDLLMANYTFGGSVWVNSDWSNVEGTLVYWPTASDQRIIGGDAAKTVDDAITYVTGDTNKKAMISIVKGDAKTQTYSISKALIQDNTAITDMTLEGNQQGGSQTGAYEAVIKSGNVVARAAENVATTLTLKNLTVKTNVFGGAKVDANATATAASNLVLDSGLYSGSFVAGGSYVTSGTYTAAASNITVGGSAKVQVNGRIIGGAVAGSGAAVNAADSSITINSANTVVLRGDIYAAGAKVGTGVVNTTADTDTTVTFTGAASNLTFTGRVSGGVYGQAVGTFNGNSTLVFNNFTGTFKGLIQDMDTITVKGNSVVDFSRKQTLMTNTAFNFDISGRTNAADAMYTVNQWGWVSAKSITVDAVSGETKSGTYTLVGGYADGFDGFTFTVAGQAATLGQAVVIGENIYTLNYLNNKLNLSYVNKLESAIVTKPAEQEIGVDKDYVLYATNVNGAALTGSTSTVEKISATKDTTVVFNNDTYASQNLLDTNANGVLLYKETSGTTPTNDIKWIGNGDTATVAGGLAGNNLDLSGKTLNVDTADITAIAVNDDAAINLAAGSNTSTIDAVTIASGKSLALTIGTGATAQKTAQDAMEISGSNGTVTITNAGTLNADVVNDVIVISNSSFNSLYGTYGGTDTKSVTTSNTGKVQDATFKGTAIVLNDAVHSNSNSYELGYYENITVANNQLLSLNLDLTGWGGTVLGSTSAYSFANEAEVANYNITMTNADFGSAVALNILSGADYTNTTFTVNGNAVELGSTFTIGEGEAAKTYELNTFNNDVYIFAGEMPEADMSSILVDANLSAPAFSEVVYDSKTYIVGINAVTSADAAFKAATNKTVEYVFASNSECNLTDDCLLNINGDTTFKGNGYKMTIAGTSGMNLLLLKASGVTERPTVTFDNFDVAVASGNQPLYVGYNSNQAVELDLINGSDMDSRFYSSYNAELKVTEGCTVKAFNEPVNRGVVTVTGSSSFIAAEATDADIQMRDQAYFQNYGTFTLTNCYTTSYAQYRNYSTGTITMSNSLREVGRDANGNWLDNPYSQIGAGKEFNYGTLNMTDGSILKISTYLLNATESGKSKVGTITMSGASTLETGLFFTNNGAITMTDGSKIKAATQFVRSTTSEPANSLTFTNNGTISMDGTSSIEFVDFVNNGTVSGTGSMTGKTRIPFSGASTEVNTFTNNANASFAGSIDLAAGDDTATFSIGGTFTGSVDMGEGSDTVNVIDVTDALAEGVYTVATVANAENYQINGTAVTLGVSTKIGEQNFTLNLDGDNQLSLAVGLQDITKTIPNDTTVSGNQYGLNGGAAKNVTFTVGTGCTISGGGGVYGLGGEAEAKDVTLNMGSAATNIAGITGGATAENLTININTTEMAGWGESGNCNYVWGVYGSGYVSGNSTLKVGNGTVANSNNGEFLGAGCYNTAATVVGGDAALIIGEGTAETGIVIAKENTRQTIMGGGGTIVGTSSVTINNGTIWGKAIIAGTSWGGTAKDSFVTINGGTVSTASSKAIYGGSYVGNQTTGSTAVTINGGAIKSDIITGNHQDKSAASTAFTMTGGSIDGKDGGATATITVGCGSGEITGDATASITGGSINNAVIDGRKNYTGGTSSLTVGSGATLTNVNVKDFDTVSNSGSISGSINMGDGASTLTNLKGAVAAATTMGSGNDKLTMNVDSVLAGAVDMGAGSDIFEITGITSLTTNIAGAKVVSGKIENCESFKVDGVDVVLGQAQQIAGAGTAQEDDDVWVQLYNQNGQATISWGKSENAVTNAENALMQFTEGTPQIGDCVASTEANPSSFEKKNNGTLA